MGQDTEPASRPERRIDPELRQRLIKRIALAALAIVVLLGGLAVIDRYYVPPPAKPPRAMSAALTPLAKPAEAPPAAPAPEAQPEVQAEAPPPPAPPAVPEQTASPSITRPASPVAAGHLRPAPQSAVENDRAPPTHPRLAEKAAPRQYVFQMGVFNDVANAQQLNDKLKESGVPSRIEARVQVGPFKTRAEAEAARKKLIELGIQPGILMPVRK